MCCPGCEAWQDILAFHNFQRKQKYKDATNAVSKCVKCKHVFSARWTNEEPDADHR